MIRMELFRIRVDECRGEQLIILKEKDGIGRLLPIVVGIFEAESIRMKVKGVKTPRPLTHDLLKNTIYQLGGGIEKIVIDSLKKGTFFAKLVIKTADGSKELRIDSRPSDAIALAVRADAPIFVEDQVLTLTATL